MLLIVNINCLIIKGATTWCVGVPDGEQLLLRKASGTAATPRPSLRTNPHHSRKSLQKRGPAQPASHERVRGYYALPLAWGTQVIGWANVALANGNGAANASAARELDVELGFVTRRPREREFGVQLEAELERLRQFLAVPER